MEIGASVGPHVGRIDTLPEEFSFVELAVGEGERRLETLDTETLADRLADRAAGLRDRAEAHGLTVCFETLGYAGGLSLERVGDLAEDAGVAVCLDVGYAYLEAGTDGVTAFLDAYGDIVEHLHVHGARHRGDTHIPVGSGDVDFETLGRRLADVDPATATIEVFTDQSDYLSASADHFRATLPADR